MNFTSDGTIRTPPTRPPLTTFPGDARTTVARRTHASGKLTLAYHAKTLTNENVCFEHCDFLTVPSTPNPLTHARFPGRGKLGAIVRADLEPSGALTATSGP